MWLDGVDGSDKIFYTTGRLTSEMVIKAAQMQIPFLVSRSGLTKMGHDIAAKLGITMIGRAAGRRYHHQRQPEPRRLPQLRRARGERRDRRVCGSARGIARGALDFQAAVS